MQTRTKVLVGGLLLSLCMSSQPANCERPVAKTWEQFVEAKATGAEPILPDFSYAGYRHGEAPIPDVEGPVYDVTKFGAVADDGKSDEPAIRAAIAAAEKTGGVVLLPAGEFHINTDTDDGEPIRVRKGHVVLRGAGQGEGGTTVRMVNHTPPKYPDKMYSTPRIITVGPDDPASPKLATVTGGARRETFSVEVDDVSKLRAGQRVTLDLSSKEAVPEFFAPNEVQPKWTRVIEQGIAVTERHSIKSIDGNRVTFAEPIHVTVNARHGWTLKAYEPIEEIGVEDIRFKGGWEQEFVHHRSALDDGGWSILELNTVANSWIRRCTFENVNHGIEIRSSAQVTVLENSFEGTRGHFAVHTRGGYGILGYGGRDLAWFHHGPSVGYQAAGTVYCRMQMRAGQRIDCHSTNPYATLLDLCDGGILYGSGGPMEALPHHMRWYTLWNFHHPTKPPVDVYDFWRPGEKEAFLKPIIVGMWGYPLKFNESTLEVLESPGTPVSPDSLYEAQVQLRLGSLPAWLVAARDRALARDAAVAAAGTEKP